MACGGYVAPMPAALARAATRSPKGALALLLAACVAFAAVLITVDDQPGLIEQPPGEALIVATGTAAASTDAYQVAIRTIGSRIAEDPDVQGVGPVNDPKAPTVTTLRIALVPLDSGERREALERILASIDPGILQVALGGRDGPLHDAEEEGGREARRYVFFGLAAAALLIAALVGGAAFMGVGLATAFALLGTLAIGKLASGPWEIQLIGLVAAAILAGGLATELALRLSRERITEVPGPRPPGRTHRAGLVAGDVALAAATAALASMLLLAIPIGYVRTAAVCGAAGSLLAGFGALVAMSAVRSIRPSPVAPTPGGGNGVERASGDDPVADQDSPVHLWGPIASLVAWSRAEAALIVLATAGALAALAIPLFGADVVELAPGPDLVDRLDGRLPLVIAGTAALAFLISGLAGR